MEFVTGVLDLRYEIHDVVVADDRVAVRAFGYGLHRTDHLGVPASGRPYAMPSMHLYRGEADRLAEHWGVRDELSVLYQVGALTPDRCPRSPSTDQRRAVLTRVDLRPVRGGGGPSNRTHSPAPGRLRGVDSATAIDTMRLRALWRYPVKSLQGEELREAVLEDNGLRGDRCWGIRDETTGRILTGRREPKLLLAAATLGDDDEPTVVLPSGDRCRGTGPDTDAALTDWLERPVTLVGAVGTPGGEAEFFADATDDTSRAIQWTMPPGRFVDAAPLLVLTTASLRAGASLHPEGAWEVRRFRPNLLVEAAADGWVEDGWCGRTVHVGAAALVPQQPCIRCTMVTRPQPDLARDLDIYKSLARHHDGTLGVWTQVHAAGSVAVDDLVTIGS